MEREAISDIVVLSKKENQPRGYTVVREHGCNTLRHETDHIADRRTSNSVWRT